MSRRSTGVPREIVAQPLRTIRVRDASESYAYPAPQLARLTALGALHRVAWGYYIVVPQERVGTPWMPTLEAAAAGIAAALFGPRGAPLMGVSAARVHGAIPRALATAVVAAPRQHKAIQLLDRDALVQFVKRTIPRLDVEAAATELGRALITTPEQTVLDLAKRPTLGSAQADVPPAVQALWPQCDPAVLERLALGQHLRTALEHAGAWVA